ncbi:MAG: 4-hydroxybenzoate octaprenyltransferase, partial [Pseudomonadales bacterium]|nr:4-hydroxybenzoate octaprenyltransferase [Pseudomonadales bacterium]
LGCILMRAAGCVINDYADRHIDLHVERTQHRPLTSGKLTEKEALGLFAVLCLLAFVLVCFTNRLTVLLSFGGVILAASYPFMKRYTHLPQVVLGAAFAWAIPMVWAAVSNAVPQQSWLLYAAVVIWALVYDTFYAMVDRDDDLKIGVKSTAILFGKADRLITGLCQLLMLGLLLSVGATFALTWPYYLGLVLAAALFGYQQYLIRNREKPLCFKAFLNNNLVGAVIFLGILLDFALR